VFDALIRFDAADWARAIDALAPDLHPVDRDATRIWFAFFPLDLHLALERARADGPDAEAEAVRRLRLMGRWRLADQIDESHRFLFAHRYWPQVRRAIAAIDRPPADATTLDAMVRHVADAAARTALVDPEMLFGITAVGLMTLRQAGADALAAAPGRIHLPDRARAMSPHQVETRRAKNDWQGPLGFLRGPRKRWTVTFDEADPEARFTAIEGQEIASAAQTDTRDHRAREPRCTPGEGPIPVECRAASCGTCWVGVLAGADRLSAVVERDERERMRVFGYPQGPEPKPILRLACQARTYGAVSIVIPPWNGFISRL
jgi:ferredoxin